MNDYFFLITSIVFINFVFFYKLKSISKLINIYDFPDNNRKLHHKPVPLIGGILLFLNFLIIILFFNLNIKIYNFNILIFSCLFFLIGLIDDKFNLLPNSKFLLNIIILLLFFKTNEDFLIKNFSFYNLEFDLNYYLSFIFSILCVLIFINALNLFDGINLQTLLYSAIVLVYLFYKDKDSIYLLTIIFTLVCLMPFNFKNRLFLGDSGVYLLGGLISLSVLDLHNLKQKISTEEIFIIMMLPGIDMLRLFIQRLFDKKNPFNGDRKHIHHLLLDRYNYFYAITVISALIFLPIFFLLFADTKIITILFLLSYIFIIINIYKKN